MFRQTDRHTFAQIDITDHLFLVEVVVLQIHLNMAKSPCCTYVRAFSDACADLSLLSYSQFGSSSQSKFAFPRQQGHQFVGVLVTDNILSSVENHIRRGSRIVAWRSGCKTTTVFFAFLFFAVRVSPSCSISCKISCLPLRGQLKRCSRRACYLWNPYFIFHCDVSRSLPPDGIKG